MYEYMTRANARAYQRDMLREERASVVKQAQDRKVAGSTFLSHSTLDMDLLPGITRFLSAHGAVVYIDKKDDTLPPYTNRKTAETLRSRIVESERFILLATPASKSSRWIPWELGLSDGVKSINKIAVLANVDSIDEDWPQQEYLGLYRRIVFSDVQGYNQRQWVVLDRAANKGRKLSQWLTS